eukprot:3116147-Rhodomonas_salina.3
MRHARPLLHCRSSCSLPPMWDVVPPSHSNLQKQAEQNRPWSDRVQPDVMQDARTENGTSRNGC